MQLGNISKYRGELMGFAIIIVMLFHVGLPRSSAFFGLRRMGNLGVDIFFFLSGIGLWYSWAKQQNWKQFYLNRALRIYPAWLIIAGYFYVSRYIALPVKTTANTVDLFGDVLINWDFWLHDELTFWYVPATMMLYLFAPPYMELIRRHPVFRWLVVLPLMWCIVVQYVTPVNHAVGHIEIFWSRVPIFFLGINCAEAIRQKRVVDAQAWWMVVGLFAFSLWACVWLEQMRHGKFPLYTERMLYIVLAITTIMIVTKLFDILSNSLAYINRFFSFVGAISLEIYLLHAQFVLIPLERLHLGYWPTFLLTFCISVPIAWVVGKVCGYVINYLKGFICASGNTPKRPSHSAAQP